jgi:hypothetical protein
MQCIRSTVDWFDAAPERQVVDGAAEARWDRIVAVYADALRAVAGELPA